MVAAASARTISEKLLTPLNSFGERCYFFPCGGATLEFLYERESQMGESEMSWLKAITGGVHRR